MRQHFAGEQFRSANAKFFPAQLRLRHVQPCGNARHCPAFAPGLFFVEHGGYAERRALAPCSLSALWRCPCPPSVDAFVTWIRLRQAVPAVLLHRRQRSCGTAPSLPTAPPGALQTPGARTVTPCLVLEHRPAQYWCWVFFSLRL